MNTDGYGDPASRFHGGEPEGINQFYPRRSESSSNKTNNYIYGDAVLGFPSGESQGANQFYSGRHQSSTNVGPTNATTENTSSKSSKKPDEKLQQIIYLNDRVKLLEHQLKQQELESTKQLGDLRANFGSVKLEQNQFTERLTKLERRATDAQQQQQDNNKEFTAQFENIRRELISDQELVSQADREVKSRLDKLDVDKALILERMKHLREDLDRVGERYGQGSGDRGLQVHETESKVQNVEMELKRLRAESNRQGKLLIGTACGTVVIIGYMLANKA